MVQFLWRQQEPSYIHKIHWQVLKRQFRSIHGDHRNQILDLPQRLNKDFHSDKLHVVFLGCDLKKTILYSILKRTRCPENCQEPWLLLVVRYKASDLTVMLFGFITYKIKFINTLTSKDQLVYPVR